MKKNSVPRTAGRSCLRGLSAFLLLGTALLTQSCSKEIYELVPTANKAHSSSLALVQRQYVVSLPYAGTLTNIERN